MYFIYFENVLNDKINTFINNYHYGNNGGLYQKIITINCMPSGSLASKVRQVSFPKVSTFKQFSGSTCKYIILDDDGYCYLDERDLPRLIASIVENGYKIDESVNKIMLKNNVGMSEDKQFIFAFSEIK